MIINWSTSYRQHNIGSYDVCHKLNFVYFSELKSFTVWILAMPYSINQSMFNDWNNCLHYKVRYIFIILSVFCSYDSIAVAKTPIVVAYLINYNQTFECTQERSIRTDGRRNRLERCACLNTQARVYR